jgi:hypothetical protein
MGAQRGVTYSHQFSSLKQKLVTLGQKLVTLGQKLVTLRQKLVTQSHPIHPLTILYPLNHKKRQCKKIYLRSTPKTSAHSLP